MTKPLPRPAWRVCARDGCTVGFAPKRADHKYCSERCQHGHRYAARHQVVENSRDGGIAGDGALVSGTSILGRPAIDVASTPQDDARFW